MSIGGRPWFLILLLPLLLSLSLSDISAAATGPSPQVIVLNSYHCGFAWSDNELAGLLARLRQDYPEIDPPIEYLDAKRLPGPDQLERMRDYLASKYRGKRIDLVIALDNPALEMATQYRREVFPGLPLVFAGINNFTPAMLRGRKKVTGVAEVEDLAGTLDLALTLHPHTREVAVIADDTTSGRAVCREMEALAPQFQDRVRFRFLPPSTFQEVVRQLQSLPANSLGLITAFTADREGQVLSHAASTRLIAASIDFPLYGTHDTRLGHGIVGGCLLNGADHGKRAAEMALKVLAGEDPDRLPVTTAGLCRFMFDYRQLTRFGIPLEALPAESVVINRLVSFYEQYRHLTLTVSWVFAFLLLAVGILTAAIVRQLRAESKLRDSEKRYRSLVETSFDWIWEVDAQGRYTYASPRVVDFLGYTPEEMLGRTPFDFMPEAESRRVREIFRPIAAARQPFTALKNVNLHRDSRRVVLETSGAPIFGPDGGFKGYRGSDRDITARQAAEQALRESEERLRLATDAANIGTLDVDLGTGQVHYSPELCAILGVPPGTEWEDHEGIRIVHPEDRDLVMATHQRSLDPAGDGRIYSEFRIIRPDGEVRWLVWSGRTIFQDTPAGRVPCRVIAVAFDITERKRAERLLSEQVNFLQLLIDTIPSPIFYKDAAGVYQGCNQSLADFLGRPKEAIIGKTVIDIYPKEQAEKYLQMDQELFQHPGIQIYEFGMARSDGAIRNFIYTKATFVDFSGKVAGLIGVMTDITERQRAEEALRNNEEKYRLLVNQIPAVVFKGYADWSVDFFDNKIEALTGYSKEEFDSRQKKWCELILPEDLGQAKGRFIKGIKSGGAYGREYRIRKKDGGIAWIQAMGQIFFDAEGRLDYISGVFFDITERVLAAQKLRESNERFAAVFENAAIGISIADAQGRIIAANPRFQEMLGYRAGELLAKTFPEITHPEDLPKDLELFQEMMTGKSEGYQLEKRYLRKNGEYFWARVTVSSIKETKEQPPYSLAVVSDITLRKQTQEKLEESARNLRYLATQLLTAQERERQRISRDLHDDLGQSLVALKLQLQTIIEREGPADLTELRQKLVTQIAFIDGIVNNVRRLCMNLRPTTLDDLGLIVALKRLFKEFGALHGIKFSLDLEDVLELLSPQAQIIIYRIFQESLTNIAKYAQAARIAVTIKRENGTIFFTVEDNGKGFDLKQVRTRAVGKRGLGLVAMEERVRMLGGTLEMKSQKGIGTKISFRIPVS